ncbi:MAG: IS630 family transposase [Candidatus Sumerlaeota bacterium]|nr:IS630 family transposase [Candidatus Sumerlaeota bacterium]
MFQDEARFGRMSDPRPCWAPPGMRPTVGLALVREYVYAYAAVSPADGCLHAMVAPSMNTPTMSRFLRQVARQHAEEFVIMVLDGASSHRGEKLVVPSNMRLIALPPYSPELNPAELLWDDLREKEFANRVFEALPAAVAQLRSTGWDWIIRSL